ncbi:MAG: Uma2 family endonuclease [Trebonia sp.]
MIVMTRDPGAQAEFMLADFQHLDTPEGYRAEFIDGEIVVSPPPDRNHGHAIWRILQQISRSSTTEMDYAPEVGLIVPSQGTPEEGRVIPDAAFAPAELAVFHSGPPWMEPDGVELVLEVTSSKPDLDRNEKRYAYAGAGIPLYLLVDRQVHIVMLFSEPENGVYSTISSAPFGGKLYLPEPFDFELDTAPFAD